MRGVKSSRHHAITQKQFCDTSQRHTGSIARCCYMHDMYVAVQQSNNACVTHALYISHKQLHSAADNGLQAYLVAYTIADTRTSSETITLARCRASPQVLRNFDEQNFPLILSVCCVYETCKRFWNFCPGLAAMNAYLENDASWASIVMTCQINHLGINIFAYLC